jgi:hypothetical protein
MDQQVWDKGLNTMAAWRRVIELSLGDELPFHHRRRFGEDQGVEDPRPHSVEAHP